MAGIGDNRGAILYAHLLALERLQVGIDDARADFNERKGLAKEDGFDTNALTVMLKRRKAGKGQTAAADTLLSEYEEAVREQEAKDTDELESPSSSTH